LRRIETRHNHTLAPGCQDKLAKLICARTGDSVQATATLYHATQSFTIATRCWPPRRRVPAGAGYPQGAYRVFERRAASPQAAPCCGFGPGRAALEFDGGRRALIWPNERLRRWCPERPPTNEALSSQRSFGASAMRHSASHTLYRLCWRELRSTSVVHINRATRHGVAASSA